jgi:hypothetical protein
MAYMSMFGADANVADARLKLEGQKLQALSRQYARGKYLAAMGQQREAFLKSEDKRYATSTRIHTENERKRMSAGLERCRLYLVV